MNCYMPATKWLGEIIFFFENQNLISTIKQRNNLIISQCYNFNFNSHINNGIHNETGILQKLKLISPLLTLNNGITQAFCNFNDFSGLKMTNVRRNM